jgi:LysM repeat protein/soluble lytic murein transglycosylase-like protein
MKKNFFIYTLLLSAIFQVSTFAQVTSTTSGLRATSDEVAKAEAKVNIITSDSGRYFKQGLLNLVDNRRPQARADFDKSVEVFLLSNVNVRKNQKLSDCYDQLIETVYRMEIPSIQQPANIRGLANTCGWDISTQTVEAVAKINVPATVQPNPTGDLITSVITASRQAENQPAGFTDQTFEATEGEKLAQIEFTETEKVDETNPVAQATIQQETQYVQVAVNRGSFGFNFNFNPLVQQYLNYYQGRGRATMETGLYKSGYFTRMARKIFREEGVPENIVWLGQVESAWKPTAQSWAAAAGLWQFIPGTGARFGLKINSQVDERRSFEKATHASARYLKFLANRYNGNWELAMGAYNCGEGNVDRAISRAGVASFWAAYPYLPKETRNYVPNILSVILIANNPAKYGFGQIQPAPYLQYDQVRVPASTNLSLIAQASDTSVDYIKYLNPELRNNNTPNEPYIIRIPAGKAGQTVAVLRKVPNSNRNTANLANVAAGESYENIANRTGASVAQLQAANGSNVPTNGKVILPNNGVKRTVMSRPTTPTASPQTTSGVRTVKAVSGDTVAKIAARFGYSPAEIAKFNGLLPDSTLPSGREIKLPPR